MKRKNKIVPYIRVGTKEQADTYNKFYEILDAQRVQEMIEILEEVKKNKRQ